LYLAHHGIKGQKWGVRNGPPYPLYKATVSRSYGKAKVKKPKVSALKVAKLLYNSLDTFDYGCIIDGVRYDENHLDEVDWKKYRTSPTKEFEKNKIGVCWDFTNYQHEKLTEAGIPNKTHMLVMETEDGPVTHTFTTFTDKVTNQEYWLEQSFYKYRGIHKINDFKDVVSIVAKHYDESGKRPFDVYEFSPDGLDKGLSDQEFFDKATSNDPVYQRK